MRNIRDDRGLILILAGVVFALAGFLLMAGDSVSPMSFLADLAVFGGLTVAIRGIALRSSRIRAEVPSAKNGTSDGAPALERTTQVSRLQAAAMKPRVLMRIRQAAAPYLEVGEVVNRAFYGQTGMPTGYSAFGALFGLASFVIVVATERHVYVLRRGMLASPRVNGLLARYRIEPDTNVSFAKGGMRIDDSQTYWVAALIAQREARDLVEYVRSLRETQREGA